MYEGDFSYQTVSKFLRAGLVDICANYTPTMRERVSGPSIIKASNEKDKIRLLGLATRIDYIFASGNLATKCINAKIINEGETNYLSDHYPVIATFEF